MTWTKFSNVHFIIYYQLYLSSFSLLAKSFTFSFPISVVVCLGRNLSAFTLSLLHYLAGRITGLVFSLTSNSDMNRSRNFAFTVLWSWDTTPTFHLFLYLYFSLILTISPTPILPSPSLRLWLCLSLIATKYSSFHHLCFFLWSTYYCLLLGKSSKNHTVWC